MTLLWWDGLESQDVTVYNSLNGAMTAYSGSGHTRFVTGISWGISANGTAERILQKTFTAASQIFAGGCFKINGGSIAFALLIFYGDSAATRHICIKPNSNKGFDIVRGTSAGTVLASSANNLYQNDVFFYLEASCTISDTVGSVEVRLNGNSTPIVTFTGDTKNAGTNTTIDAVGWGVGFNSSGVGDRMDDFYVCNSSGPSSGLSDNTFLGDVMVVASVPTGAGADTGLTASTGSNWATVDETPASSTDYSGSATSGARDLYACTDLPSGVTAVYGVRMTSYMHKSDAGAKSMKPAIKVGSTNYYGATQALNSTMARYDDQWVTSPDTSTAWTTSEVNAAQIGAEVI